MSCCSCTGQLLLRHSDLSWRHFTQVGHLHILIALSVGRCTHAACIKAAGKGVVRELHCAVSCLQILLVSER